MNNLRLKRPFFYFTLRRKVNANLILSVGLELYDLCVISRIHMGGLLVKKLNYD